MEVCMDNIINQGDKLGGPNKIVEIDEAKIGRTTLKCLIGIAPGGPVCFVSSLYASSISETELIKVSGISELLDEGDEIMADKDH
ncbi:hypothetical protein Btru_039648 [Bulinus truncatus]|nr:hypothetical protein Btru_039648 [Bulinus truncatus]